MKKFTLCLLSLALTIPTMSLFDTPLAADTIPPEADPLEDVIEAMMAMQRRAWEQGVAAQALLELGRDKQVILLAKDAVVNQRKDGRLGLNGPDRPVADPASNGEPLLFAAKATGDPELKEAADRMLAYLLERAPRTDKGIIYHNLVENRIWVDSIYMLPPFLAVAGYPEEAVRQIEGYREILFNAKDRLYKHIWDEDLQTFTRDAYWGVGNGWAAAGMARVINALPDNMKAEKKRLAGYVREVLDGCLAHKREDGLFHDVLDDPESFVETNLSQMLAYTIYRGIDGGWLDSDYLSAAEEMRLAAHRKVDAFGLVQGVCGAPNFDRSGTAVEGQAFYILMEAARRDLKNR